MAVPWLCILRRNMDFASKNTFSIQTYNAIQIIHILFNPFHYYSLYMLTTFLEYITQRNF